MVMHPTGKSTSNRPCLCCQVRYGSHVAATIPGSPPEVALVPVPNTYEIWAWWATMLCRVGARIFESTHFGRENGCGGARMWQYRSTNHSEPATTWKLTLPMVTLTLGSKWLHAPAAVIHIANDYTTTSRVPFLSVTMPTLPSSVTAAHVASTLEACRHEST